MTTPVPVPPTPTLRNPGDEVAPGTPQTAQLTCPICEGSGKDDKASPCAHCGGTGLVIVTVGEA